MWKELKSGYQRLESSQVGGVDGGSLPLGATGCHCVPNACLKRTPCFNLLSLIRQKGTSSYSVSVNIVCFCSVVKPAHGEGWGEEGPRRELVGGVQRAPLH